MEIIEQAGAAADGHGFCEEEQIRHRILMVSDFFYPNMGGVENHLFQLSLCLIKRGHKVVMLTHSYGSRKGVRYLSNGLKVYYAPFRPFYNQSTFPTFFSFFPLFRNIVLREGITIVHGHQAFSTLTHECIFHGRTMGYRCCFTDHSLFGFADASSIHMNKLLKFTLSDVDHVICVSHTSKENTVLRAKVDPLIVSTIPNAVDATSFTPDATQRDPEWTNIIVMSRLVYRKGVDLLVGAIPILCRRFSRCRFIIGGDGPKRIILEEMREKHMLHERVELLGAVPAHDVRKILVKGDIFLNCSLTEAFCIAIVEAAACGLVVVSTKVGGVPEVLPDRMIIFAEPAVDDIVLAVGEAISRVPEVHPQTFHKEIASMYNWHDVAERTEQVYDRIATLPSAPLLERFRRYFGGGPFAGRLFCFICAIDYLFWRFLEWWQPRDQIDEAVTFPYVRYMHLRDQTKEIK